MLGAQVKKPHPLVRDGVFVLGNSSPKRRVCQRGLGDEIKVSENSTCNGSNTN